MIVVENCPTKTAGVGSKVSECCQKTAGVGSKVSECCQKMVRHDLILRKKMADVGKKISENMPRNEQPGFGFCKY